MFHNRCIRFCALLLTLLPSLILTPQPAYADQPIRDAIPIFPFTLSDCGFTVLGEPLQDSQNLTVFVDHKGEPMVWHLQGDVTIRYTNLDTGNSIEQTLHGLSETTFHADGSMTFVNAGHSFGRALSDEYPPLFLVKGRAEYRFDAAGNEMVQIQGKVIDLCAELSK